MTQGMMCPSSKRSRTDNSGSYIPEGQRKAGLLEVTRACSE